MAGLALALVLASCGPAGGMDVAELESQLRANLLDRFPTAVSEVTCPGPLDPEPGDRVVCQAQIGSRSAAVELTFLDRPGAMDVTVLSRLVDADEIAIQVGQRFAAELGIGTDVDCGSVVVVIDDDQPVLCEATDARGATHQLQVDVDAAGGLRVRLR